MTDVTCAHPNCYQEVHAGKLVCPRHWGALTDELREELKNVGDSISRDEMVSVLEDYFSERLIGDHEVARCRKCGADIVFFISRAGRPYPVDASGVDADDEGFKRGKHTFHSESCKGERS